MYQLIGAISFFIFATLTGCSHIQPKSKHYVFLTKKYCPHGLTLYTDNTCRDYRELSALNAFTPDIKSFSAPTDTPTPPAKKHKKHKKPLITKQNKTNKPALDCKAVFKAINQCMK